MPPMIPEIRLPDLIVAADWGVGWAKRWMARAVREEGSTAYSLSSPVPVGASGAFLERVRRRLPEGGTALVGLDFPIGLPAGYADRRFKEMGFREILKQLMADEKERARFFTPTDSPCLESPFGPGSPKKPGAFGPSELARRLKAVQLRRECDERSNAHPLFHTLGARQVGRAAGDGWQHVLGPALDKVSLWPFDGLLSDLLARPGIVIAEIYPALFFGKVSKGAGKEDGSTRRLVFEALLAKSRAAGLEITLTATADEWVEAGFASSDDFDPMLSVVGMLRTLLTEPSLEPPDEPRVREVEGWILGPPRQETASRRRKILPQ